MKEIIFTNALVGVDFYPPKPAIKDIPEWYINTPEYDSEEGRKTKKDISPLSTAHTIKKCMPVFDSMTAGYILYTQVDVQVFKENGQTFYTWADQNFINFHPLRQAELHPKSNKVSYPKWMNSYGISTPPGYSVLFIQPFHRESVFTILPGIVDTDTYKAPVSFPFVLNDANWEGIIPAGTPMAQVIPFKRESWKHKIGAEKELKEQNLIISKVRTLLYNSYKRQFWARKEYK